MAGSRETMIRIAREQIGAHYIFGGFGNKPDFQDPHCIPNRYGRRVRLLPNENDTIYAASTVLGGNQKICCGRRSQVAAWQTYTGEVPPDPTSEQRSAGIESAQNVSFPRPDDEPGATTIYGESCVGKRHFDCLGFLSWLIWRTSGRFVNHKVKTWSTQNPAGTTTIHGFVHNRPETYQGLRPGDILIRYRVPQDGIIGHIGVVSGRNTVIHARGKNLGVQETPISAIRWDFAGVLHRSYLNPARDRPTRRRMEAVPGA